MNSINAIIIDDEKRSQSVLASLLEDFYPKLQVVGTYDELITGVKGIKQLEPDVVFLDIQMPEYAGYEIVKFFKTINFHIVFVTAYDQYAIKAFELSALDYLLKPINRDRLRQSIEKLFDAQEVKEKYEAYQLLAQNFDENQRQQLVIPELGNRRIVNVTDIIAITADGSYTTFYLIGNVSFTTSKNLKHYSQILETYDHFFRSHRAWLINLDYLEFLNKTVGILVLKNGIKAKLSRYQIKAFKEKVNSSQK